MVSSTLIVDDDADIRTLLRVLIEDAGHGLEVAGEAANGADAVRLWRETAPDVIVLDQAMPGLSGMDVAEIILGERPDQAIVMFTANPDDYELCWATRRGVRAVLDKPHWSSLIDTLCRFTP